jgi:multidrug efflux pump subunit AcrB
MASAYMQLEKALRRVQAMRDAKSSEDAIETEIELARSLWAQVPVTPKGQLLVWDDDIQPLAAELGFDPDTRATDRAKSVLDAIEDRIDDHIDDKLADDIDLARRAYQLVAAIDREIRASVSGITDLEVAAAGATVVLSGFAADETAKSRAGSIAAQAAPASATIENHLVIKR